jgi:hypothetical protein
LQDYWQVKGAQKNMGLQRAKDIEIVIERFSYLRNIIEISVAQNLTSLNVISENFFRDLLNMVLGSNFENLNVDLGNAAAIDLGDIGQGMCIQVTSTPGKVKITKTVKKFVDHELHKKYSRLIVLIATKKTKFQSDTLSDPASIFEIDLKKDVWDWDDLVKFSNNLPQDELANLRKFVEEGIKFEEPKTPLNEVGTFIDLMEILSNETHDEAGKGILNEPDPDGKIRHRFLSHADYLLEQYGTHFVEYGAVLAETIEQGDLGSARIRRLGLHLSTRSDDILGASGGDPKDALNKLVEFYTKALQSYGKNSDEGAVRFFMLDQMVKCHVFPNPVMLSA